MNDIWIYLDCFIVLVSFINVIIALRNKDAFATLGWGMAVLGYLDVIQKLIELRGC